MKNYSKKWILQRITAVLLIPISFWFIYNSIFFASMNYNQIIFFFKFKFNSFLFLAMMTFVFLHNKLGCQTIIDDYIKSKKLKTYFKLLINILTYILMIISLISIIKITFYS